jgi:hypothetical protein
MAWMKKGNDWARLLAYVQDVVNQRLLLQNKYVAAENRILRAQLLSRLRLLDPEGSTLAEIGERLGRKALKDLTCVTKPDTILAWYRRLIAKKFDGSKKECLSKLILLGEGSLKRALTESAQHYHSKRNQPSKGHRPSLPLSRRYKTATNASVRCIERLGGLLGYYCAPREFFD